MDWAKQHPVETLAEWGAPALLAAAAGWAARSASLPAVLIAILAILTFAAGALAMRVAGGRNDHAVRQFEPAALELDELLLEAKDEVLMLDDPLVEVAPDSRVVRLFSLQEQP